MTDATTGPRWSRRDVLRRTAAVATGGTLAAHTINESPRLSPVDRADALALSTAVTLSLAVGAAGGAGVAYWRIGGDTNVDPDEVAENNIYNAAVAVGEGRSEFETQMQSEFVAPSDPEATPFGRTAWQELRVAAARDIVNGESVSTATTSAQKAVDEVATRAVVNQTERWNTFVEAMIEQIVLQQDESVSVINYQSDEFGSFDQRTASTQDNWTSVDASIPSGGSDPIIHKWEMDPANLPVDPTSLDGRDEPLSAYGIVMQGTNDVHMMSVADSAGEASILPDMSANWPGGLTSDVMVTAEHSSLSTENVIDQQLYHDTLAAITSAYDSISGKLSTYVQNLHDGIQQGAIDPSDILSSQDLIEEFADSEGQARLAAELAAIGAHIPDSAGYRAKVSHPDIQADSVWGHLFPQYADGTDPTPIQPGNTIPSADYTMAYFGYEGAESGEWEQVMLSGDSDLQILDVEGVDGQQDVSGAGDSAGASGKVVVYSGDSPPDPLANPGNHTNWTVLVQGETNKHTAAVSNVTTDSNGDFVLSSTSLTDGESIDYVELVPPVNQSRPHDYTADETNIDTEQTKEQIKALRQQQEDLEEALNSGGGGGGGSILPDFGGGVGPLVGLVALGGGAWALIQSANN